jgi:hypothetical protein
VAPKFTDNDKSEFDPVDLGRTYFKRKLLQEEQDKFRKEFFQYATESFSDHDLSKQVVLLPEDQQGSPEDYIRKYYPDWTIKEIDNRVSPVVSVVIQENPELKSFTKIIKLDSWDIKSGKVVFGYVISRSISSGQIYVDDERLAALDFDLYWEVTEMANEGLLIALDLDITDEELVEAGWPRLVKSPDALTAAQIDKLKPYLHPAPSTAKLLVRYAKEDEEE